MLRRRAPGGGRKPIGATPARSLLTIRMPDHMRDMLEAEARKNGVSLTQELLSRIRASRNTDHNDRALRALYFLIARVAQRYIFGLGAGKPWHLDPFAFKAFRLAVNKVLERLQPPGEIVNKALGEIPPGESTEGRPFLSKTPEEQADWAAKEVLKEFFRSPEEILTEDLRIKLRSAKPPDDPHWGEKMLDEIERSLNAMASARKDLGFKTET